MPGGVHMTLVSPLCGKKSWIKGQNFERDMDPRLHDWGPIFPFSEN